MKFGNYTVCRYSSSSIKACLKVNKGLNISVSIGKYLQEYKGMPAYKNTHNTASRRRLVNKRLNQRDFNRFVLPCPGWGVRGSVLSKIKKLLTSDSVLIENISYLFVFDMR